MIGSWESWLLLAVIACCMPKAGTGEAWEAALAFAPCEVAGHDAFPGPSDCVSGSAAVGYEFGCCHIMSAYASRATGKVRFAAGLP